MILQALIVHFVSCLVVVVADQDIEDHHDESKEIGEDFSESRFSMSKIFFFMFISEADFTLSLFLIFQFCSFVVVCFVLVM